MTERMHRTQILLTPEQHSIYTKIAQQEGRSLSAVVREVLQRDLEWRQQADEDVQRYVEKLERIRQHRQAILERRKGEPLVIDPVETLHQLREERDEQLWKILDDRSD